MCSAGAAYEHKNTMMSLVCMWSGTGTQGLTFTAHQASTDEYKALTKCLIVFVQNNAIIPVTFLNHMQTEIKKIIINNRTAFYCMQILSHEPNPPFQTAVSAQLCFCTSSAFSSQSWSDVPLAAFLSVQKDSSMTHIS